MTVDEEKLENCNTLEHVLGNKNDKNGYIYDENFYNWITF